MEKFETVYWDEFRSRYVIDLDLLDIDPATGMVNITGVIRVLQDYRNSWSHLKTFTKARTTKDLFKLAYVDKINLSHYKAFIASLQARIAVDLLGGLAYFYEDGKMPAEEAKAKEYCGPSIYNPVPEFTVTDATPFNPFSRILVDYPTDRILQVEVSTEVGYFKAPFIVTNPGDKMIVFSGSVATINSELQKVTFVPGEDTASIIIAVDDGVGIIGSVSSTTVRVSGHDEPLTPSLRFTPTTTTIGSAMDQLVLNNVIKFSGTPEDIVSLQLTSSTSEVELKTPNGTIVANADTNGDLTNDLIGDINQSIVTIFRDGIDAQETTVTVSVTLSEAHESEIITASFIVSQVEVPKPTLTMVPETHAFGTSRDTQRLVGVVKFTGKADDVSEIKFISHYYNAQLVSSAGNVIAKEYVPEIILEESKWGTLTDLDINIIRNGAGAADEPISVQYTLSEKWSNEVLVATLQVTQEDYGIPSVTQKSEIIIAGDQDTVEFLASDLFELHNIAGDADVPYITYSSNEFIVDVFYNDTQFLRVQPGDSQIFGGDQTYEMISGGKIRIHRLGDEAKDSSFNIDIKIGYTQHNSVINFSQEAKAVEKPVIVANISDITDFGTYNEPFSIVGDMSMFAELHFISSVVPFTATLNGVEYNVSGDGGASIDPMPNSLSGLTISYTEAGAYGGGAIGMSGRLKDEFGGDFVSANINIVS